MRTSQVEYDLTTRTVSLDTLRPHPANPRNSDIEPIKASIVANGVFRPLVITPDGTVLCGKSTYASLLALGRTEAAVVTVDVDPASPRALAIMLADNRTADLGRYDETLLLDLLTVVDGTIGLEGSGYASSDVDSLRRLLDAIAAEPLDPSAEWEGMPDHESDNMMGAYKTVVHFLTDDDAEAFFEMIGQSRKRSVWYPQGDGHQQSRHDVAVVAE